MADGVAGRRVPFNEPAIMSFDDYSEPDPLLTVKPFIDLTDILQPIIMNSQELDVNVIPDMEHKATNSPIGEQERLDTRSETNSLTKDSNPTRKRPRSHSPTNPSPPNLFCQFSPDILTDRDSTPSLPDTTMEINSHAQESEPEIIDLTQEVALDSH